MSDGCLVDIAFVLGVLAVLGADSVIGLVGGALVFLVVVGIWFIGLSKPGGGW